MEALEETEGYLWRQMPFLMGYTTAQMVDKMQWLWNITFGDTTYVYIYIYLIIYIQTHTLDKNGSLYDPAGTESWNMQIRYETMQVRLHGSRGGVFGGHRPPRDPGGPLH